MDLKETLLNFNGDKSILFMCINGVDDEKENDNINQNFIYLFLYYRINK